MPATSDPPSGSVMPSEPMSSPASVGRTKRSIRSWLPECTMCGSAMPCVNRLAITPPEAPASIIASVSATESSSAPP